MKFLSHHHLARLATIGMRFCSLTSKLVLTLYIAHYLSLSAMGYFGLVNGAVFILMVVLGMRLDYVVARELVGATPVAALSRMRDQAVVNLLNQSLLALLMLLALRINIITLDPKVMLIIFVLSVLENWGDTVFLNFISLGRPLVANLLYFIRTALWVFPAVGFGLVWPELRDPKIIFLSWILSSTGSVCLALFLWRDMPWKSVMQSRINWDWIRDSVRVCFPFWMGSLGGTAGFYIDRFVLAHNMPLSIVGVATFYISFGGALAALIHSGVLSFSYPRLIAFHRDDNRMAYKHEVQKLAWHVALLSGILGIGIGVIVPFLGHNFGQPELAKHAATLWLIIIATWLRCNSETLYYILFSQHKDGPLWVSGLIYLIPSLGCNIVFVPMFGLIGIGYSAIISNFLIFAWRGWHVLKSYEIKLSFTTLIPRVF